LYQASKARAIMVKWPKGFARPQRPAAVCLAASAGGEWIVVEPGTGRLAVELCDDCVRHLAPDRIEQQGGDQRAVNDQARTTLDRGQVLAIAVNAVAVEGQRGPAQQQDWIGRDAAPGARSAASAPAAQP
jgi:hypothetical protein